MNYRYANKRMALRGAGGRFRRATMADFGMSGFCPKCGHIVVREYDGDPRDPMPDPRRWRNRCLGCEPRETPEPAPQSVADFFDAAMKEEQ